MYVFLLLFLKKKRLKALYAINVIFFEKLKTYQYMVNICIGSAATSSSATINGIGNSATSGCWFTSTTGMWQVARHLILSLKSLILIVQLPSYLATWKFNYGLGIATSPLLSSLFANFSHVHILSVFFKEISILQTGKKFIRGPLFYLNFFVFIFNLHMVYKD